MDKLELYVESLIFSSSGPIGVGAIRSSLEEALDIKFPEEDIRSAIQSLTEKYKDDDRFSFSLAHINEGYLFMTKGTYFPVVSTWLKQENRKRLSRAAMETLSIIAYKQPVTKPEVEHIRGVNCDYTIQKLLDKELITITGRSEGPGRPIIYGTSEKFMHHFGLGGLEDLPRLKDLHKDENRIGEPAPLEEGVPKPNVEDYEAE